jgi:CBS-domain-containing membrane protein
VEVVVDVPQAVEDHAVDELPVVDPEEPRRLIGMIRRKESIAAYNRRVIEHKQEMGTSGILK